MPAFADIAKYTRLAFELRHLLRNTVSLEQSKQVISARLQNRANNFLRLVQKGIYGNTRSPYLKLLKVAGCEFGDIESLVNQDGIETTLHKLLAEGVYLSWEEFTGKKDVTRNGICFQFMERDFDNPFLPNYYLTQSSGSRSAGTRTLLDLSHRLDESYYTLPMLAVNNALDLHAGLWLPQLPSAAGIARLLDRWIVRQPAARWFSPVNEKQMRASLRDRLAMRYIIYGGRLWGAKLVKPEYVSLEDAVKIAQWMAIGKKKFGGCSLESFVSSAIRVCQVAIENGLDIAGTHFFVAGEPLTKVKRQQIEAAGAVVTPRYFINGVGFIGCGCPSGDTVDDVHFFKDSLASIQHLRKVEHVDMHINAFLFTSLSLSATKILLNVESDDYGVMESRNCGCLFEQMGFTEHLRDIRSFAKLTGSGMTIIGSDFVRILEEVLPQKFGGTATDYQLLEEEDEQGQTKLSLIISPSVGTVDEDRVINIVLSELRRNIHGGKLAAGFWSQINMLRVQRRYPLSSSGKVLTLHLTKRK